MVILSISSSPGGDYCVKSTFYQWSTKSVNVSGRRAEGEEGNHWMTDWHIIPVIPKYASMLQTYPFATSTLTVVPFEEYSSPLPRLV